MQNWKQTWEKSKEHEEFMDISVSSPILEAIILAYGECGRNFRSSLVTNKVTNSIYG